MIWEYMFALLVPTAWDEADDIEYTYNQSHLFSNNIPQLDKSSNCYIFCPHVLNE